MDIIPACDVPVVEVAQKDARESALHLPEISEVDLGRHYTELAKNATASTMASIHSAAAP